jgi:hypothetical protein
MHKFADVSIFCREIFSFGNMGFCKVQTLSFLTVPRHCFYHEIPTGLYFDTYTPGLERFTRVAYSGRWRIVHLLVKSLSTQL